MIKSPVFLIALMIVMLGSTCTSENKNSQTKETNNEEGKTTQNDDPAKLSSTEQIKKHGKHYLSTIIQNLPSKHISSRTIEVLFPADTSGSERFPVLYMFDGQNLWHSFEGWGGEPNKGWRVDKVLDSLYEAGTVSGLIVVGIHNSENRTSDYMPEKPRELVKQRIETTTNEWYQEFKTNPPKSDLQLKFLVDEVKPYIDARFPTKKDRANTFISGSSMGGLLSAYAICEHPEVFGGAACFSTHWPPLDGVFLEYLKSNLPDPSTHKIYFDYGTETLDAEYEPYQKIADIAMLARGYEKNKNWMTLKFEGAKHYEDDWYARFHIPIQFLLKKN